MGTESQLGSYRTIVADPPWEYEHFPPSQTNGRPIHRLPNPYPMMTLDAIQALPVGSWAHPEGARLFMWTTNRYLPAAFEVLEAWGFGYRQTLVWRKTGNPSPFVAHIAPNTAEYLLVATRNGSPERGDALPAAVIDAPKGKHSAKPEAFMDYIEAASPGPYLEMFSRRARIGWDTWGNESLAGGEAVAL